MIVFSLVSYHAIPSKWLKLKKVDASLMATGPHRLETFLLQQIVSCHCAWSGLVWNFCFVLSHILPCIFNLTSCYSESATSLRVTCLDYKGNLYKKKSYFHYLTPTMSLFYITNCKYRSYSPYCLPDVWTRIHWEQKHVILMILIK